MACIPSSSSTLDQGMIKSSYAGLRKTNSNILDAYMGSQCDAFSRLNGNMSKKQSIVFRNIVEQHIYLKQESAREMLKAGQAATLQQEFSSLAMKTITAVDESDGRLTTTSAKLSTTKKRVVMQPA